MILDLVHGLIERRILVNFRVDPQVLARVLPAPFEPQIVGGYGIAGICFIRLAAMRPRPLPAWAGFGSENAAHRVAVTWSEGGERRNDVFVPRRDSTAVVRVAADLLAPWEHRAARFDVRETDDELHVAMTSDDGTTHASFDGEVTTEMPSGSVFPSVEAAQRFFRAGSRGYSPSRDGRRLHAVELVTKSFPLEPLRIDRVTSSWFADLARFPASSVELDSAFAMRNVEHRWRLAPVLSRGELRALAS